MTPSPSPTNDWSLVSRRRRHKRPVPHPIRPPTLTLNLPSPWSPSDPHTDPARESRLLKLIQSSINRLETSCFYRRFLSRLQSPRIQIPLSTLAPESNLHMVVYGIGSIEFYPTPRLQLALALLLRRHFTIASIEVFDPVLSAAECAVVEALGCRVIQQDEQGRRVVEAPTIFYMPHCEAVLYDNLLQANWRPVALNRMVVLGNSFSEYGRYVEEMGGCGGSVAVGVEARHVLGVRKYVREVGMEGGKMVGGMEGGKMVGVSGEVEDDDDDGFFKAFHDMSWHFFDIGEEEDMGLVGN